MSNSALLILITVVLVSMIDYLPRAFLLVKKAIPTRPGYTPTPRFLIMPTVYGNISYLQNIHFLKKYADKVVICTSKYESQEFYRDLRRACRKYGFRYTRTDLPTVKGRPVKNAYTIYKGAFANLKRLGVRKATPCLIMDADTYAEKYVNNLIRTFIKSNLDMVSLRCEVANPKTKIETLQAFEYKLAMDNRRMDPWLTSGACSLARAAVFQRVFSRHSDFFAGGDIEIGKLAQVMGYKIRYMDFTFYTAAPNTIKAWFNQRVIWFAGGFRHHVANIGSFGWLHFFMLFYNSLLVYLLLPLRWIELVNFPPTLALLIVLSWIYTSILAFGKGWQPTYLLLPFYSFVQSMIILPVAIVRYFKIAWAQRSFGILHHELSHNSLNMRLVFKTLNISSAALVIYAAVTISMTRWEYWRHHGYIMNLLFSSR
jgi:cellulose synthase/poly-beta-1,6-N-acetylglucosamine synthase-like glycosyltransferase